MFPRSTSDKYFKARKKLKTMLTNLTKGLLSILLITLIMSSCTDPQIKQRLADLQTMNDSLTLLINSTENCCECGELPSDLTEIDENRARESWNRYENDKSGLKIRGTWLDKENNWYLYCTYKSNIYTGIALNENNCPMVVYAVQLVTDKDTSYKYYALSSELSEKDCSGSRKASPHSGTCPTRCP